MHSHRLNAIITDYRVRCRHAQTGLHGSKVRARVSRPNINIGANLKDREKNDANTKSPPNSEIIINNPFNVVLTSYDLK